MKWINAINNVNTGPNIVGFVAVVRNGCCVGNQSSIVLTQWDIFPYTYTPYFIFCVFGISQKDTDCLLYCWLQFPLKVKLGLGRCFCLSLLIPLLVIIFTTMLITPKLHAIEDITAIPLWTIPIIINYPNFIYSAEAHLLLQ